MVFTDEMARVALQHILQSEKTAEDKYDLLHELDVDIQNCTEKGMASPVIPEILEAQYELTKCMPTNRSEP